MAAAIIFILTIVTLGCSGETPGGPSFVGRCWRDGVRCANLVLNGGVDPAPSGMGAEGAVDTGFEPFVGPWVFSQLLGEDMKEDPLSAALLFTAGGRSEAVNDEYNQEFHPKYEPGFYTFSFWVSEDSASFWANSWTVRLKLRDWWNGVPGDEPESIPPGAMCCYVANMTLTRGIEQRPSAWNWVTWTFSVPLVPEEWDTFEHLDPCLDSVGQTIEPYDSTTVIPGGYAIVVTPNDGLPMTVGILRFDDFTIERTGD